MQVSRWTFKRAPDYGDKVYLVVTRQDSAWSAESDNEEPYALAVVVSDRENAYARLYAELRAALEARVEVRARARARV